MSDTIYGEKLGIRLVIKPTVLFAFFMALTFIMAGRIDYWQGWIFNGLNIFFMLASYIVLRDQKDLISERQKPGQGMKKWDKIYYLASTLLFFTMFTTSVLDAGRFSWSPTVPVVMIILGCVVYSLGQILVLWAKRSNRFFSSVVRIQADRDQIVCTEGPYRFVRHQGYLGGLMCNIALPLLLGSYCGLILAVPLMVPLIVRTYLEDKTLYAELAGYRDYVRDVSFRLFPHVW
jgi:protein-S-isoprenylcysteine O-methyltransferase Ste14